MEDFTGEVGLKLVTRVLAYPGIGHKILLRSQSSHIFLVPLTFLMISKGMWDFQQFLEWDQKKRGN